MSAGIVCVPNRQRETTLTERQKDMDLHLTYVPYKKINPVFSVFLTACDGAAVFSLIHNVIQSRRVAPYRLRDGI